jgi:DNA mismatch endonuclease, patch repair protein
MTVSPSSKALLTTPARSALMKRVGRKDTAPELLVRRYLHALGFRYRLHDRRLPGTPDLVLPRCATAVFVNGCFWHGHDCAHGAVAARSNADYWAAKIDDNRRRDESKRSALRKLGWCVEVIWECGCRDQPKLAALARRLLRRSAAPDRSAPAHNRAP